MLANMYGLTGLANTTVVYMVMFGIDKYWAVFEKCGPGGVWVFIFTMSAFVYYVALYLNTHPEIIISMFQSDLTQIQNKSVKTEL